MARYGWLTVPKNLYEKNKEDFDFSKSEITAKTVSTVEVRFPDDSNEDFRDLCKFIFDKFPDAPFDLSQEEAEGGYDFSSGVDSYIRPGKEQLDVYWNDNFLENASLEELRKCSSFEELQEVIKKHEEARPTNIDIEAEIYNKNHPLHKYKPETKEELKALANDDSIKLSEIDVSKITDMSYLFKYSTRVDFSGIENWDVSHVTNMSYMFYNSKFNQSIDSWDVSHVTDMSYMFSHSPFNQSIDSWDVSHVTDMFYMFSHSPFNQSIDSWDVSNVKFMSGMFYNSKFNQSINSWDVSHVEDMESMFEDSAFNQPIEKWNIKDVTVLGLYSQVKTVKSFEEALNELVKSHIEAGETLPDIGKQLKGATEKTMLELGKAHIAGKNSR